MKFIVGVKTGCAIIFGVSVGYIFSNAISDYISAFLALIIALGSIGIWITARRAWIESEKTIMQYVGDEELVPRENVVKILEVLSK